MRKLVRSLSFLASLLVASCGDQESRLKATIQEPPAFEPLNVAAMPETNDPVLARGRKIYLENCERCHRIGKAGAPPVGNQLAWAKRIEQGMAQLEEHAIEGHESPSGNEMPPRGGNSDLSDSAVIAAVHFMISLSRGDPTEEIEQFIQQTQ